MEKKIDSKNAITRDEVRKNTSRALVVALSVNSILDEIGTSPENITSSSFLKHSLTQLKWVSLQVGNINKALTPVLEKESVEPLKLFLAAKLTEIPTHIERAQSAIVRANLNSINQINNEQEKNGFEISIYNLRNDLYGLHTSLTKLQPNLDIAQYPGK